MRLHCVRYTPNTTRTKVVDVFLGADLDIQEVLNFIKGNKPLDSNDADRTGSAEVEGRWEDEMDGGDFG